LSCSAQLIGLHQQSSLSFNPDKRFKLDVHLNLLIRVLERKNAFAVQKAQTGASGMKWAWPMTRINTTE